MGLWDETQAAVARLQPLAAAVKPQVAVILGSGAGSFATRLEHAQRLPYGDIPHFPTPHVAGHAGELVFGSIDGTGCAVMSGRVHGYEGHSAARLTFGVRVLAGLGIKTLVVTNASGGINPSFEVGDFMVIHDHINLTGDNALRGPNDERFGPRFPDMTTAYGLAGRRAWHEAGRRVGVALREGVYVAMAGPSYETPAEIRMLQRLGADAVGMSTVHEVTAARHMGLAVSGLSIISNKAAGMSPVPLSHQEVTETAQRVQDGFCKLLAETVKLLG